MTCRWACVVLVAACTGGGGGGIDAGQLDAGADAAGDAAPDADPLADTDGDGVIDSVDVCPAIADPAQVDLDGDQLGWMCDPVESTTIPFTGVDTSFMPLAVRGNSIGAAVAYGCVNGTCTHESLSVGPGGVSRAMSATDAWLAGHPIRAFVGAENHVLWSMLDGVLGDQDASTDTFTSRHTGGILEHISDGVARYERGPLLVLASAPQDVAVDTYDLLAPQPDGSVATVATSTSPFVAPVIVGHASPRLVFGTAQPGQRSVREFVPGSNTSQAIVVDGTLLSNVSDVRALSRISGGTWGFCAEKGGTHYLVETFGAQVRAYEAPLSSCLVTVQQTNDHQLSVVGNGDGAVLVLNGVATPLALDGSLTLSGTGLPAVLTRRVGAVENVYVIDNTGTLHPQVSDGLASAVAREGDTLHFLSNHGANLALARYRNGTTSEVSVPAIPAHESWSVFTTKEGAALLSSASTALVWPSQAGSATTIDFDHMDVLVRGNTTVFVASHNAPTSQPALYAYTEVAGVPQYTPLTPEVFQNVAFTMTLAPLVETTDWFTYTKNGDCRLVRPVIVGAAVTLAGDVPCPGGVGVVGMTASGQAVLEMSLTWPQRVFLLDGTTLTEVAKGSSVKVLHASPQSRLVLGWTGRDLGDNRFLCQATHPDRCWTPPQEPHLWAPVVPAQPDEAHVLFTGGAPGAMVFTSIRTFGPGQRPQPL